LPVFVIHDQHMVGKYIPEGQMFHVYAIDFTLLHRSYVYLQRSSPRLSYFDGITLMLPVIPVYITSKTISNI